MFEHANYGGDIYYDRGIKNYGQSKFMNNISVLQTVMNITPDLVKKRGLVFRTLVSQIFSIIPSDTNTIISQTSSLMCYDGFKEQKLLRYQEATTGFLMKCILIQKSVSGNKSFQFTHVIKPNPVTLNKKVRSTKDGFNMKNTIILPSFGCNEHICLVRLTGIQWLELEITSLKLPDIDHSYDCLYEGFTIMDGIKHESSFIKYENNIPVAHICSKIITNKSNGERKFPYTKFYSMSETVFIALHVYHPLMTVFNAKVSIKVSLTECQGILIKTQSPSRLLPAHVFQAEFWNPINPGIHPCGAARPPAVAGRTARPAGSPRDRQPGRTGERC